MSETPDAPVPEPTAPHPRPRGRLRLRYTALSDVGRVRKDNQDSGYAGPYLLAVADGVGGSARGDVASSAAIEELRTLDGPPAADLLEVAAGGIEGSHQRISGLVAQHPEIEGTSTTVTACVFDGERFGFAHVGDSRGYLLRAGTLTQLTKDHSFVQTLIDEGRITEAESRVHPHRHLILRAVDGVHESEPDLFYVDAAPGDRLMLCSDGASGVLDLDDLAEILAEGTVENAARALIRSSLDAGSTDNVTVVVADVVDTEDEDPDETQAMLVAPVVVGAAAERRRGFRRRVRHHDTGELDAVLAEPADDGGPPVPVDPESVRYAPRAPRRFTWVRRVAAVAVVLVLVGAALKISYDWSQRQYYVGEDTGKVTIFRGVDYEVPFVTLSHVYQRSDTNVSDLPDYFKGQVRDGMTQKNLAGARAYVSRLGVQARCQIAKQEQAAQASQSPTPTASPTHKPTQKSTQKARKKRSSSAQPTKKPSSTASKTPTSTPSTAPLPDECTQ